MKKPKDFVMGVTGHHRSGTTFLRTACNVNFGSKNEAASFHHALPKFVDSQKRFPRIYITREWENVAKSMWALKERFGIGADTFEEFQKIRWRDQWKKFPTALHLYGTIGKIKPKGMPTTNGFATKDRTPPEWHRYHIQQWKAFAAKRPKNVLIVTYEDLLADYQGSMLSIASFLKIDRTEFETIKEKVGIWRSEEQLS